MPNPFVLTSEESLLWESIRPQFRSASGEKNVAMTDAFAKSAKENIAKFDTKTDYGKQLPLLVLFLKAYPEYIESTLPALYKHACKHNRVRHFLDEVHEHSPQILAKVLPAMFSSEKALAVQIPLLMDMGQYLDKRVFETLDFKLLLKATPEKLLKAFTPTPATWDAFMELAKGLIKNESTQDLAQNVAYSVGLQVATSKSKEEKHAGIAQYDWVDTALYWQKHGWEWNVGETLETMQLRAKGSSLVTDMLKALAHADNPHPEKALDALQWVREKTDPLAPSTNHSGLDAAIFTVYQNTTDEATKAATLAWFNDREHHCEIFQNGWRSMTGQDMVQATQKVVDNLLAPMGVTKASLLSRAVLDQRLPGGLAVCGSHLYTLLNHSSLPLGSMNEAMEIILQEWTSKYPNDTPSMGSHDYRKYAMEGMLDTIVHDLQEPARLALKESNAFKQLILYCAYMKHINEGTWSQFSWDFMPDLTEKPLSMLSVVYPENQDSWAKLQQKVLDKTFKREDTVQLIAKVLFNQDLTVNHILSTCSALGCAPEVFFCSLQSPGAQAFIPESFDFSESSPA